MCRVRKHGHGTCTCALAQNRGKITIKIAYTQENEHFFDTCISERAK